MGFGGMIPCFALKLLVVSFAGLRSALLLMDWLGASPNANLELASGGIRPGLDNLFKEFI